MKIKILIILLLSSSLFGYLEWGKDNSSFLFEGELELLKNMILDFQSTAHPFTFIPLLGQLLLVITVLQKTPSRILIYLGISSIGLLLVFMFFIGLTGLNFKILVSTLPFILFAVLVFRELRIQRTQNVNDNPHHLK